MPEMDGYETMRHIRADARFASLPIIAVTAKALKDDREKCIDAGASDYLPKPIDNDRLIDLIRMWVAPRGARGVSGSGNVAAGEHPASSTTTRRTSWRSRRCCSRSGTTLVRASSGEEALKAVLRHEFALIIMDVQMPGIDGFQTGVAHQDARPVAPHPDHLPDRASPRTRRTSSRATRTAPSTT